MNEYTICYVATVIQCCIIQCSLLYTSTLCLGCPRRDNKLQLAKMFTVAELIPVLLKKSKWTQDKSKKPSGQHSYFFFFCCFQLLSNVQHTDVSFSPLSSSVDIRRQKDCLNGMHLIHFKCFESRSLNFQLFFTVSY